MPAAKEYWALWRYHPPAAPDDSQIPVIASDMELRRAELSSRQKSLAGIQLELRS
jgi:hypothetical protein